MYSLIREKLARDHSLDADISSEDNRSERDATTSQVVVEIQGSLRETPGAAELTFGQT